MSITGKLKEEIKSLILIGMGEEIAELKAKLNFLIDDNKRLTIKISKIEKDELEIFQRLSNLEGRFDNLAQDTWLKVENEILKTKLKKLTEEIN